MHLEVLVEDSSGGVMLEHLIPRIIREPRHTHRIVRYREIGRLPAGLQPGGGAITRMLLDKLPALLGGYGKSLRDVPAAVVVVVDLDSADCRTLRRQLLAVLGACNPAPRALFCIAIEEMEAWLLGDPAAVIRAYPEAKQTILRRYVPDSICGTWETLAEAVYPGGARGLRKLGYPIVGDLKHQWAQRIAPLVDVETNTSQSFQYFRDGLRRLVAP